MFFAVDLPKLRTVIGSNDSSLIDAILSTDHRMTPEGQTALREIVAGACAPVEETIHEYGYALEAICGYLGEAIGSDVYNVADHPYQSRLVANRCPVEIPVDENKFPEIGYLELSQLETELKLVSTTRARAAKQPLAVKLICVLTKGTFGRGMDAEEVEEDMEAYAETLQECINANKSLVSFRH